MKYFDLLGPVLVTISLTCGSLFVMQGSWVHAKATAGQWLIERAWDEGQKDGGQHKPWPWADFYPAAMLTLPLNEHPLFILDKVSGEALAFGPGISVYLDDQNNAPIFLIQAHNDTHFSALKSLKNGDEISLRMGDDAWQFKVDATQRLSTPELVVEQTIQSATLLLSTCDDDRPNRPSRYVVSAHAY